MAREIPAYRQTEGGLRDNADLQAHDRFQALKTQGTIDNWRQQGRELLVEERSKGKKAHAKSVASLVGSLSEVHIFARHVMPDGRLNTEMLEKTEYFQLHPDQLKALESFQFLPKSKSKLWRHSSARNMALYNVHELNIIRSSPPEGEKVNTMPNGPVVARDEEMPQTQPIRPSIAIKTPTSNGVVRPNPEMPHLAEESGGWYLANMHIPPQDPQPDSTNGDNGNKKPVRPDVIQSAVTEFRNGLEKDRAKSKRGMRRIIAGALATAAVGTILYDVVNDGKKDSKEQFNPNAYRQAAIEYVDRNRVEPDINLPPLPVVRLHNEERVADTQITTDQFSAESVLVPELTNKSGREILSQYIPTNVDGPKAVQSPYYPDGDASREDSLQRFIASLAAHNETAASAATARQTTLQPEVDVPTPTKPVQAEQSNQFTTLEETTIHSAEKILLPVLPGNETHKTEASPVVQSTNASGTEASNLMTPLPAEEEPVCREDGTIDQLHLVPSVQNQTAAEAPVNQSQPQPSKKQALEAMRKVFELLRRTLPGAYQLEEQEPEAQQSAVRPEIEQQDVQGQPMEKVTPDVQQGQQDYQTPQTIPFLVFSQEEPVCREDPVSQELIKNVIVKSPDTTEPALMRPLSPQPENQQSKIQPEPQLSDREKQEILKLEEQLGTLNLEPWQVAPVSKSTEFIKIEMPKQKLQEGKPDSEHAVEAPNIWSEGVKNVSWVGKKGKPRGNELRFYIEEMESGNRVVLEIKPKKESVWQKIRGKNRKFVDTDKWFKMGYGVVDFWESSDPSRHLIIRAPYGKLALDEEDWTNTVEAIKDGKNFKLPNAIVARIVRGKDLNVSPGFEITNDDGSTREIVLLATGHLNKKK